MKRLRLHCTHAFHMVKCICGHPHFLHVDRPDEDRMESGHCTARNTEGRGKCLCEEFRPIKGYRPEQLEHETIPVEGINNAG